MRASSIRGWMTGKEMQYLASQAKDARVLEIGSFAGRSARAMLDSGAQVVYCVDPLDPDAWPHRTGQVSKHERALKTRAAGDAVFQELQDNLHDAIEEGRAVLIRQSSAMAIPQLREKFDLAFIDGDHAYKSVKRDIRLCRQVLAADGVLLGHDYALPEVSKAVQEMCPEVRLIEGTRIWREG